MKTYLVTGGAGFIGSNFIIYMLNKHHYNDNIKIINLDKLTYAGNLCNLHDIEKDARYSFMQGDICDENVVSNIFDNNQIDYVVNFAAESHVDRSIHDPDIFVKTNVMGTVNLLNIAKKYWSTGQDQYLHGVKFMQISTDEVYGSLGTEGFFLETTPMDPHSPYSAAKASADHFVNAYFDTYKLPINVTRCSNNYGPFQFPEKLIPLIINNALNHKSLPIYGDGLNVRDWLFVEDHCKAIDMVINKGKVGEVYNVGGYNEMTNINIVKTIIEYLSSNTDSSIGTSLIKYVEDRKGHDKRYAIDSSKIQNELGWVAETKFEEGIKMTVNWYLNNAEWMTNVLNGEYKEYYEKMYGERKNR